MVAALPSFLSTPDLTGLQAKGLGHAGACQACGGGGLFHELHRRFSQEVPGSLGQPGLVRKACGVGLVCVRGLLPDAFGFGFDLPRNRGLGFAAVARGADLSVVGDAAVVELHHHGELEVLTAAAFACVHRVVDAQGFAHRCSLADGVAGGVGFGALHRLGVFFLVLDLGIALEDAHTGVFVLDPSAPTAVFGDGLGPFEGVLAAQWVVRVLGHPREHRRISHDVHQVPDLFAHGFLSLKRGVRLALL